MQAPSIGSNPFILMMDPASVFEALERSDRLGRVSGRICRPLDQPSASTTVMATGNARASDEHLAQDEV